MELFTKKINSTDKTNTYTPQIRAFPTEFLNSLISKNKNKNKNSKKIAGLSNYRLKSIHVKSDGDVLLDAEQYYTITMSSDPREPNNMARQTTTHYYLLIVVVSISKDGEINWTRVIPKSQSICNHCTSLGVSYASIFTESDAYFIYNTGTTSKTVLATLSNDGELETTELFNYKKDKAVLIPSTSGKISENSMFLCTRYKSERRIGILTFD